MQNTKGTAADTIIKKLDPKRKRIAERLRLIVKKTVPDAAETVKCM